MADILANIADLIKTCAGWFAGCLASGEFWVGVPFGIVVAFALHFVLRRKKYKPTSITINIPFGLGN